jgi:hypothetical protein
MGAGADARGRCVGGLGRRWRRVRLGCAQYGGVVSMSDGAVTFKGGTITNTTAVRTGHNPRSHAGTGCRMLQRLRRAVCCMGMRDSMVRSSFAVSAACRMPHLGMGRGFMRLVACRCTLCCIAWYGAPLRTVRCLAHRVEARPGSGCSSGVAAGTQTGVRGSGFSTIGG